MFLSSSIFYTLSVKRTFYIIQPIYIFLQQNYPCEIYLFKGQINSQLFWEMNQKVILYWNLGSQPARAVKALLDIGHIPHQLVTKDVVKDQTRSKQFLQMNPLGQIPFLVHGNVKIAESNAIMVYLCQVFDSIPKHYYGSTPEQRAKSNQFLSWYQYYFRPALFKIIKIKVYGVIRKKIPFKSYQIVSARKQMIQAIKTFDQLLKIGGNRFTCGDSPNIADLLIYFQLTNVICYNEKITQFKFVSKWYEQVERIREVKKITNEWLPISNNFSKILASIKALDEAKSSL